MPYQPQAEYRGDTYIAQAGQQVGSTISSALTGAFEKYEEKKKQQAFNDTTFDYIAQNYPQALPAGGLQRYHDANGNEKAGIVLGAQKNVALALARYQAEQQAMENAPFTPTVTTLQDPATKQPFSVYRTGPRSVAAVPKAPENVPFTPTVATLQDPVTKQPFSVYSTSPHSVAAVPKGPEDGNKPEAMVKFSKEVKARTGADLGDWEQATNKRMEGDDFVADFPKRTYVDETSGKTMSIGGTTRRIPKSTYDQYLSRLSAIERGSSSGGAADIAAPTQQQQALDWARNNPSDPRAAAILKQLGMQ